ncbi:MAG: hypothetical protein ACRYGP_15885 [Janthinobacterium lividum]
MVETRRSTVKSASARTRVGRLLTFGAALALALATLFFVLRPLSLVFPAAGLDASWTAVLAEAALRPARWGVDLAFTYGPASTLATRFYTDRYLVADLPILCAIALVNGAAMAWLARHATVARASGTGAFVLAVGTMAAGLAADLLLDPDGFFFVFCLTLVFVDLLRRPDDRASLAIVMAGAALMGVLALSKTSFGVVALLLFAVADVRALLDRFSLGTRPPRSATGRELPRLPVVTLMYAVAVLATFLAYGQHLGDLPAYFSLQGQVAAGYGEAMYISPGRGELAAFLLGATALTILAAGLAPVRIGPLGRAAAALSTAVVLLIACKAGFIRADSHPQIAWMALGLAAILLGIALALPRSVVAAVLLAGTGLVVLWIAAPLFAMAAGDRGPALNRLPEAYRPMLAAFDRETGAWASFLRSPTIFAAEARASKAAGWAAIRAFQPLPALEGGVDVLPPQQSAVLASGLDYRPRPSFQDYSTYTAGLIAANADFYAGPMAPAWVLFDGSVLDDRYPTTGEGALWPVLLRDYEPVRHIGGWLALHRRTVPLPEALGSPVRIAASLGSSVEVPLDGPVFVHIKVEKTLLGRLAGAIFRPPALSLRVTLADGAEKSYRFVPAIAAGGFLLTPIVSDPDTFAVLATAEGDLVGAARVRSFVVGGSPWASPFYGATMTVEFQPLTVTPAPPSPDARALFADVAAHVPWRRLVHALGRDRDLYGDDLTAQPPNTLAIPLAGERRLRVEFGLEDEVWNDHKTGGVCFVVKASRGAALPLWRRCLDPVAVPSDRGRQSAELDLPQGLSSVTAETTCLKGCEWTWSYWSMIVPQG